MTAFGVGFERRPSSDVGSSASAEGLHQPPPRVGCFVRTSMVYGDGSDRKRAQMMGTGEILNVEAAVLNPADHFGCPMDVVKDPRLTKDDKQRILESWARDAELLSQAEAENMQGAQRPRLQEAKLALLELKGRK
jgi:hypothetical protein